MEEDNTRDKKREGSRNLPLSYMLFFDKLLKNANASVMVSDSKGQFIYTNSRFVESFGFSRKEIIGKNWIESIIPKEEQGEIGKVFDVVKGRDISSSFETPVLTKDGDAMLFTWISVPLQRENNMFIMFVGKEGKYDIEVSKPKIHEITDERREEIYKEIIDMLFHASEKAEPDTARHCVNVTTFATALARKLNMDESVIERLKLAALLHDVGKLAIDEKILFKKGKLDHDEYEEMKKHAQWGAEIIYPVYFLRDIIPIVVYHHENYDGTGYPYGLKGEEIPIESRVLSVADIYEALTSDRPYRKAFSREQAIAIMKEEKGTKLDPKLTDIFLDMVSNNEEKNA